MEQTRGTKTVIKSIFKYNLNDNRHMLNNKKLLVIFKIMIIAFD